MEKKKLPSEKRCTKCGEMKPLDQFFRDKKGKYGRKSVCKACVADYKKEYSKRNASKRSKKSRPEARKLHKAVSEGRQEACSECGSSLGWFNEEEQVGFVKEHFISSKEGALCMLCFAKLYSKKGFINQQNERKVR